MSNFKTKNGITLIALIITIIVLLILAVVSISLVINSGIIGKAKTGVDKYSDEEVLEQIKLAYSEWEMARYSGQTSDNAQTFMTDKLEEVLGLDEGKVTVTESSGTYSVVIDGKDKTYTYNPSTGATGATGASSGGSEVATTGPWTQNGTTVTNSTTNQTLEVGDKVYYNSGVTAYEGSGATQGKWGVLGVENGNLLLLSTENVQDDFELSGKEGYLTGVSQLNTICEVYKNETYASSARSIKVEDINRVTGYTPAAPVTYTYRLVDGKVKRDDSSNTSSVTSFEDVNGTVLTADNSIDVTADRYFYETENYFEFNSKISKFLVGEYTDNGKSGEFTLNYWLASECVGATSSNGSWGLRYVYSGNVSNYFLYYSNGGADGSSSSGVRAVVSLKSDVQLEPNGDNNWKIK